MNDPSLRRLETGNRQLDRILGGGFPAHSLNIIMGHPGTGKTVLAEQMLFHNAGDERPVLYLTTVSEPLAKVLSYLQGFSFFEPDLMGDKVIYEDMGHILVSEGIEPLVERVKRAIRELGPRMIVIDSFKVLHDLEESRPRVRRLLSDLAGAIAAYDTTAFLVGEYTSEQVPHFPEFAVADGVVRLEYAATGKEDQRFLRVLKLRGTGYMEGLHAFRITRDGLEVFPRLVTPPVPEEYSPEMERVGTGIPGLDDIMGGGPWRGSSTLVLGPEGSGKTTMGLGFCFAGARAGEPSLFLNFQEDPSQLARSIQALGVDLAEMREGGLHTLYASPVELQIDSLVERVFELIERERVRRIVIDSAGDLALAAADAERFHDYVYSLLKHFATRGVTSLLTLEGSSLAAAGSHTPRARFASMTDAIVELGIEIEGGPRRTLRVVKARGIDHDLAPHEMKIHQGGLRLLDDGDGRG